MKYCVGIPVLYGAGHTQEAIESVVHHPDTELLIIDNGAEMPVKEVISYYASLPNVFILRNPENLFVNPAWNQILNRFLESDSDYLMIMNSDLILHKDWKEVLDRFLGLEKWSDTNLIVAPVITSDKNVLNTNIYIPGSIEDWNSMLQPISEGPPGVLIILNKEHAQLVYPIPETLKVWFGDTFIFNKLRSLMYKTVVLNNLLTYHSGSQNISRVPGISEIIEQDKIEWAKLQENGN